MMKNKKKIIISVAFLLFAGAAYKMVLAKPAESKAKVHGSVYVLPKEFVINLADGRFAKLGVGLVLPPEALAAEGGHGAGAKPPEGYGPLPQEGLIRDIVTDSLTGGSADDLVGKHGRDHTKHKLLKQIKKHTDVEPDHVLFTDIAIQ